MVLITALVRAVGTLTFTGVATDTQTVVVGGKTYTTQTSLTDSDGNVLIGADETASCANLAAAINLGSGSGTTYAASMTESAHCTATSAAAVLTVTAKVPGVGGNLIDSTETQTNATWGAAVLASGSGNMEVAVREIRDGGQVNSGVLQALDQMDESATSEA